MNAVVPTIYTVLFCIVALSEMLPECSKLALYRHSLAAYLQSFSAAIKVTFW